VTADQATDWVHWHDQYDDPTSALSHRLAVVRGHIRDWLDRTAPEPVTLLSSCAGDGRDLLPVLAERSDAGRVRATLLEFDGRNAATARAFAQAHGLISVRVEQVDAGDASAYVEAAPSDLVMLCGIFGNITDDDVQRVVETAPELCRPGAQVIWTRHHNPPDLTPHIRQWFADAGFAERAFDAPADFAYSVGVHDLVGPPKPLRTGRRLFTFVR
jgi:hypothetical protein